MKMQYSFHAYGHPNILGTHKATLEFTKDSELSLEGNCIVGVRADFELSGIKKFIKNCNDKKIAITIQTADKKITETIHAELNQDFNDENEMVIRKGDFVSERTLAVMADKSSMELKRELVNRLKNKTEIIINFYIEK